MENYKDIYDILANELRTVKITRWKVTNVANATTYAYGTPSAEAQLLFREELRKVKNETEFAYGRVHCKYGVNAARENLNRIFKALPKLPAGQEYGFARDTVFTLPMPKSRRDILCMNMSPWIKAKFEEEE